MIGAPCKILTELCNWLELEIYPGYLEDCCSVLFARPTVTRRKLNWDDILIDEVAQRARAFPFLQGYSFERIGVDP